MLNRDILKRAFIVVSVLGTGLGSIFNDNTMVIIGVMSGIVGAMMLIGILK